MRPGSLGEANLAASRATSRTRNDRTDRSPEPVRVSPDTFPLSWIRAVVAYRPLVAAIHLTFDDGPAEATSAILDALAEHDAKATFFQVGRNVAARPEL